MMQSLRSFISKMGGVQVLSHTLLQKLDPTKKLDKIFDIVKSGEIIMIEGRLTADEETTLISKALRNVSGKFTGIEIAFLEGTTNKSFSQKLKDKIVRMLAGDRFGLTVIGPSKIIKEIKMNPEKLEIMLK